MKPILNLINLSIALLIFSSDLFAQSTPRTDIKDKTLERASRDLIVATLNDVRTFDFDQGTLSEFAEYIQQSIRESVLVRMEANNAIPNLHLRVYLAEPDIPISIKKQNKAIGLALSELCIKYACIAVVLRDRIIITTNKMRLEACEYEWLFEAVAVVRKTDRSKTTSDTVPNK